MTSPTAFSARSRKRRCSSSSSAISRTRALTVRAFDAARQQRLRQLLDRRGLGALLVVATSSRDPDLAPFVGPVHLGESILVVPRDGTAVLGISTAMEREEAVASGLEVLSLDDLSAASRAADTIAERSFLRWQWALEASGIARGPIGLAGRYPAGAMARAAQRLEETGWRLEDFGRDLLRLRRPKTAWETAEIRRAADGAVAAFRCVARTLAAAEPHGTGENLLVDGEPLTAGLLRRRVAAALAARQLEQPEGNIVAAGRDAAVPHSQGDSARVLRAGETIVVDLYPKGALFADCTRTFCVGEIPSQIVEAHEAVRRALSDASRALKPGCSGPDLQAAVCDHFEAAGWPTARGSVTAERGYVHGLGHGVGYELHELPAFRGDEDSTLRPGDVVTLEPGLYDQQAALGVRLEDLFVVERDGAECLTPLPYELDPGRW